MVFAFRLVLRQVGGCCLFGRSRVERGGGRGIFGVVKGSGSGVFWKWVIWIFWSGGENARLLDECASVSGRDICDHVLRICGRLRHSLRCGLFDLCHDRGFRPFLPSAGGEIPHILSLLQNAILTWNDVFPLWTWNIVVFEDSAHLRRRTGLVFWIANLHLCLIDNRRHAHLVSGFWFLNPFVFKPLWRGWRRRYVFVHGQIVLS